MSLLHIDLLVYLDHLKIVQDAIHFKYIRGHGLFCDDVAIYRECELDGKKHTFYNYTYLDRIMDSYLENNMLQKYGKFRLYGNIKPQNRKR